MPRLQITRRTSLLSTNLRAAFLEAFGHNISANATSFGTRRPSDVIDLHTVARRVQVEIRRTTGRYCPLRQVLWSIQDLASDRSDNSTSPVDTLPPPTPRPIPIIITSTTPTSSRTFAADASASRYRTACNRPPLQFQLSMPPRVSSTSTSPLSSPCGLSPTYTMVSAPFIRHSHLSGGNTSQPITPIDQIARTPLTPPKLPRLVPPAPGTWSRLNVEARRDGLSPLETPTLPLTSHPLGPTFAGKPVLGRLQIPDAPKEPGLHRSASALFTRSPQMLSPFDLGRGQLQLPGAHSSASSSLTRAALLRPALARSFSQTLQLDLRNAPTSASDRATSPLLSPFAGPGAALGSPLASPFVIRPEGGYFCV